MNYHISNFRLAHKALQILCKRLECDFIDLPVIFDKNKDPRFENGSIVISDGSLLDTMASIYSVYVNFLGAICGRNISSIEDRNAIMNLFLSVLRDFNTEYKDHYEFQDNDEFEMKLDQFHVVWQLMKNIFCPYKNMQLLNPRVIAKKSGEMDASCIVSENNNPYIFVNLGIAKTSVRSAFLLVEALRFHMKDDSPESVIREVFSNFYMRDRLIDFLGMVFLEDSEVASFLAVLSILCNSVDLETLAINTGKDSSIKIAQSFSYSGNWWFLGLTEKMLESVRGPDWSTTESLKDFSKDLWDKVEVERRRRGMSELPFEMLLRIQSEELKTAPNQTLQQLLSKTRIW
jgi:hypothetical protein